MRRIDLDTFVGRVRYDEKGDLREPQIYIFQGQEEGGSPGQEFPNHPSKACPQMLFSP